MSVLMKLRLPTRNSPAGASRLVPVTPIKVEGVPYVVANRRQSGWARNLRATGGGELIGWLGGKAFRAVEIDGGERERVVASYRKQLGRAVRAVFERLPNPADHPTFRLELVG